MRKEIIPLLIFKGSHITIVSKIKKNGLLISSITTSIILFPYIFGCMLLGHFFLWQWFYNFSIEKTQLFSIWSVEICFQLFKNEFYVSELCLEDAAPVTSSMGSCSEDASHPRAGLGEVRSLDASRQGFQRLSSVLNAHPFVNTFLLISEQHLF